MNNPPVRPRARTQSSSKAKKGRAVRRRPAVPAAKIPDLPVGSRGESVYLAIRAALHDGLLKPGQRLLEVEVANWLGVSRTPVREALHRLETAGLVEFAGRRGVIIAQLDQQRVIQLYAMREVLEGTAARFAAQHASDFEIRTLRRLVEAQGEKDDAKEAARRNTLLHEAIYSAAHNTYLVQALNALTDALQLLGQTTFSVPGRPATANREHRDIVDAIESRDPDRAEEAARNHIRAAGRLRLDLLFGPH